MLGVLFCEAKLFRDETKNFRCGGGKIQLKPLPAFPELLQILLDGKDERSSHFLGNLREYNNTLSMTSLACNEVHSIFTTFKIYGQSYHYIGSVLPSSSENLQYVQLYFLNNEDEEAELRRGYADGRPLDLNLLMNLQSTMHNVNS